MQSATDSGQHGSVANTGLIRLAHCGLMACGLFAAVQYGALSLERHQMPFSAVAGNIAGGLIVGPTDEPPVRNAWARFEGVKLTLPNKPKSKGPTNYLLPDDVVLSDEMRRVRDWVTDTYGVPGESIGPVLASTERTAREAGLDPLLVVAVMAIESSFNPRAVSQMGAQGLMQVIPRWHLDKLGDKATENALFDPLLNVQVGTQVLVEGLKRFGSMQAALQYYGGARNDPEARYSKKVMAMKRQLASITRPGDV